MPDSPTHQRHHEGAVPNPPPPPPPSLGMQNNPPNQRRHAGAFKDRSLALHGRLSRFTRLAQDLFLMLLIGKAGCEH